MNTLAQTWADGGPGPWILLFPLFWAVVVIGVVIVLRRTVWRHGRNPWQARAERSEHAPLTLLGRRFAAGEIDEDEYRRRLSVLEERFGTGGKGAAT
ncbi:SHOCT domain-containing protein [Streptomyces netropsis]|uniref:Putative membrane protein n=1 Tax=Streptomyces netropsis TaxID=55404 RepID=A0A7W7PBY4_STRNE|nr:SHOCT domain-containing protein [Streptomyces netropsis]MBB4885096.1 putative membrane protein [Streptomyces netropsis]GGR26740.1 hypothetical protein GCM10010219_34440 [Streptomyces netropsis]